ncbi:hypothetical protein [Nocardioides sp.]|uniref:hypothetical protein n=1 Tax=Nocardioides sp. TaxID=35761 RepID=UPI002B279DF0|nr:hypothetical protein [Nocardioides sp.]
MRDQTRTRLVAGLLVFALVGAGALAAVGALVGGLSGDDDPAAAPRTPIATDLGEPLWNPCDALAPTQVAELFGSTFDQQTGTAAEPRCIFTPTDEGGTILDINYQLYDGTLQDIVDQLGDPGDTSELLEPGVPGASGARIVVDTADDALAVTGLVRNGRLVQVVNALDLSPYDKDVTVDGVEALLAALAARAEDSGLNAG